MWRPIDWEANKAVVVREIFRLSFPSISAWERHLFEAGAAALLKAVRDKCPKLFGITIKEAGIKLEHEPQEEGTWYFIPDDK